MKILFISYFYPPLGGPAALRSVKTVKYLTELGCTVDVISVGEIEYNYKDDSLLQLCKERRIIRTTSLDPMSVLKRVSMGSGEVSKDVYHKTPEGIKLFIRRLYPLDDKVGWLPFLIKAGRRLLQENDYDLIYVSCGPFSSAVVARQLAKRFRIPYVLEMRDYWTLLSDYDLQGFVFNRAFSRFWEKRLLNDAALVVSATQGIASDLAKAFGMNLENKTFVLFNGHDEADFADVDFVMKADNSFIISYFGALYARRSLKALFAALKELGAENKLPENLQLRLYGNYHLETLNDIEQSGIEHLIKIVPQLSHKKALQEMARADALLLVINSGSPKGTLTSKVFEYLRIGKPIIALVPQYSEAAELLQESGQTHLAPMESREKIKSVLSELFQGRHQPSAYHYQAAKYERSSQVKAMLQRLESIKEKN